MGGRDSNRQREELREVGREGRRRKVVRGEGGREVGREGRSERVEGYRKGWRE